MPNGEERRSLDSLGLVVYLGGGDVDERLGDNNGGVQEAGCSNGSWMRGESTGKLAGCGGGGGELIGMEDWMYVCVLSVCI